MENENNKLVVRKEDNELKLTAIEIQNKFMSYFDPIDHMLTVFLGKPPVQLERSTENPAEILMDQTALVMYDKTRLKTKKFLTSSILATSLTWALYKLIKNLL